MKTNIIAFTGSGLLILFALAFASIFEIRLASAQVDATSSPASIPDATTTPVLDASTSTVPTDAPSTPPLVQTDDASSTTEAAAPSDAVTKLTSMISSVVPIEPAPIGFTLVHIIGYKYTDYFTDGTTEVSFPGDPKLDDNLAKAGASIPSHEGLTWVHTTSQYLYDTPSGDLEVGDYALQPSGTYIGHRPPFISSTSTPAELTTSTLGSTATDTSSAPPNDASSSTPDTSASTVPSPSDNSSSTTTGSEPITPTL